CDESVSVSTWSYKNCISLSPFYFTELSWGIARFGGAFLSFFCYSINIFISGCERNSRSG
ncbi:MAG: hypothetical protein LBE87_17260, partial [Serratia marcescens]|nr:hypothetical protein [Serratia marcescens]